MSNINRNYQSRLCYKSMSCSHQGLFDRLVNAYANRLNQPCIVENTLFTPHDFNKHCNNIYKIVSDIILANAILDTKEWLILNIAILFHDISMSGKLPSNIHRETHSLESADFVLSEWDNNNSILRRVASEADIITQNDIYAISHIIRAHSDVKDGSTSPSENGLNDPQLSFNFNGINSLGLACVLRLADELDVTSDRIGSTYYAEQLSSENDSQRFSAICWEDLRYCSSIEVKKDYTFVLVLNCDDYYIKRVLDSNKTTEDRIKERVLKIVKKINETLEMTNEKAFACIECSGFNVKYQKIVPKSGRITFETPAGNTKTISTVSKEVPPNRKEGINSLPTGGAIWLPDAELATGEQTRFKTYSKVGSVSKFIPDRISADDSVWGISAIKGAGKTFLLQVKRVKVSPKYFTIPLVSKPSADNKWATETITSIKCNHIHGYSVEQLSDLWEYCIVCHVLLTYKYYLSRGKAKVKDQLDRLITYINSKKLTELSRDLLNSEINLSLDSIMLRCVKDNWPTIVENDYSSLCDCLSLAYSILLESKGKKKSGFALFLDKIDQFITPPDAEDPPTDCSECEYKERTITCNNPNKNSEFCTTQCTEMCCYTCSTYEDPYAGTKTRTNSSTNSPLFAHVNYWQYFQLALISAAYRIKIKLDGMVKVFFTVREEALHCEDNIFHDSKAKVFGIFERIYYSKADQKIIFYEAIQNENNLSKLFDSNLKYTNPEYAFIGVDILCHPYVEGLSESVFDSIYRHSFDRARDIQQHGKALSDRIEEISSIQDQKKREEKVKEIIEITASQLLLPERGIPNYYEEKMDIMPRYWRDRQHFLDFIQLLDRNLLFSDDIIEICRLVNNKDKQFTCDGKDCIVNCCAHHPFSFLYNLGLLGYVSLNESHEGDETQIFVNSNEITYFHEKDELYIDPQSCYLLHPALTKAIETLKKKNIHHFKGFIIGKSLPVPKKKLKKLIDDKMQLTNEHFEQLYFS